MGLRQFDRPASLFVRWVFLISMDTSLEFVALGEPRGGRLRGNFDTSAALRHDRALFSSCLFSSRLLQSSFLQIPFARLLQTTSLFGSRRGACRRPLNYDVYAARKLARDYDEEAHQCVNEWRRGSTGHLTSGPRVVECRGFGGLGSGPRFLRTPLP